MATLQYQTQISNNPFELWPTICKNWKDATSSVSWVIEDGANVKFGQDNWIISATSLQDLVAH